MMVFLIYLAGYLAVVRLLIRVVRLKNLRIAVAALAVIVPVWDLLPIWIHYRWLCARVPEIVVPSEPIRVDGYFNGLSPMGVRLGPRILDQGFAFVEMPRSMDPDSEIERVERASNGQVIVRTTDSPVSRYWLERSRTVLAFGTGIGSIHVTDKESGQMVAWETWVTPGESWLLKALVPRELRYGSTACRAPGNRSEQSVEAVLRPRHEQPFEEAK